MNVIIEDNSKKNKKMKIFYVVIILICIISVIATIIIQVGEEKNKTPSNPTLPELTNNQISQYKDDFDSIFENKVNYLKNNSYKISKLNQDEEIIYIGYKNNESQVNDYELDVKIPYININNKEIEEFNKQIKDTFEKKAKSVINSKGNNIIYSVNYCAYISNNILSLVIRSTLKEGSNPQRDIIQTYNYDLDNQKKYTIDDILKMKNLTKKEANKAISKEIKKVQEKVVELRKLGYEIYERDYTSDMYSINNVTEYFIGEDNALYIVYAYGNENNTSEMDIVVM